MRLAALALIVACLAGVAPARSEPYLTTDRTFEEASIAFINMYMQRWSSPNPEALAYMDKVFPDEILYFNQAVNHTELMQRKRRFAERWPLRSFAVRSDGISVSCDQQHLCTVWGLVDWLCRSLERHATASGTSVFAFQIQDGQTVVDEDGFVISRGQIVSRDASDASISIMVYSNADLPELRRAFYNQSNDPNWITKWLAARRPFSGTARSLGQFSARELADSNGSAMPYAVFQSSRGQIACMMKDKRSMPPLGEAVHLGGNVALFIGNTMYLSNCIFG